MPPIAVLTLPHRFLSKGIQRWLLNPSAQIRAVLLVNRTGGFEMLACVGRDPHNRTAWRVTYLWRDPDGTENPTGHIALPTFRAAMRELRPATWQVEKVWQH